MSSVPLEKAEADIIQVETSPGSFRRAISVALTLLTCAVIFAAVVIGMHMTSPTELIVYTGVVITTATGYVAVDQRHPGLFAFLAQERLLIAIAAVAGALALPLILNDGYQVHVLAMAAIFAIMAVGLNVTIGYAGLAGFGYIAYYAIGAYTSAILSTRFGLDFWLCLPIAGVAAALLSLCVAFPALRVRGHYLALVTLGFSFIILQLITNLDGLTGGTEGIFNIELPQVFGHSFSDPITIFGRDLTSNISFYYLALAILVLAAVAISRLQNSRWGRVWAAMRMDETAAEASGINVTLLKLIAFSTGSSLGGIAGALYAHMVGYIDPSSFHTIDSIFLLAVVALGNWRIAGVIAAAAIFVILPEKLRVFEDFRPLIFAVTLLLVMLARGRRMIGAS